MQCTVMKKSLCGTHCEEVAKMLKVATKLYSRTA